MMKLSTFFLLVLAFIPFQAKGTEMNFKTRYYSEKKLIEACEIDQIERKKNVAAFVQSCMQSMPVTCRAESPSTTVGGKPNPEFDKCMKEGVEFCTRQGNERLGVLETSCAVELKGKKYFIDSRFKESEVQNCGFDSIDRITTTDCIRELSKIKMPKGLRDVCSKAQNLNCWKFAYNKGFSKKLVNFCKDTYEQDKDYYLSCIQIVAGKLPRDSDLSSCKKAAIEDRLECLSDQIKKSETKGSSTVLPSTEIPTPASDEENNSSDTEFSGSGR